MIWQILARLLAVDCVADYLIRRAKRTPYTFLRTDGVRVWKDDGKGDIYMRRWWLCRNRWFEARIHHIVSPDPGRDMHDHPWPFRTFILRGWYSEQRRDAYLPAKNEGYKFEVFAESPLTRLEGDTYAMNAHDRHRITGLCTGGAWSLFITRGPRDAWGFYTPKGYVDHNEYK